MTGDERVLLFVVVYLTQNEISSLQDYNGILVNKKTYRELLPLIYRFRRHQKKQMVFFLETFLPQQRQLLFMWQELWRRGILSLRHPDHTSIEATINIHGSYGLCMLGDTQHIIHWEYGIEGELFRDVRNLFYWIQEKYEDGYRPELYFSPEERIPYWEWDHAEYPLIPTLY